MRLLLDTHVLLWAIDQPMLLSENVRNLLLDEANELHASVASIWEIALKVRAGKLKLPAVADYLVTHLRMIGVSRYLPVELIHVYQTANLPPIHKDPFDRILLAQALTEGLTFISKDGFLTDYPVPVIW